MSEILEFLKAERNRVREQIAPFERTLNHLNGEIRKLEGQENLEAAGLKAGDLLATTPEFLNYILVRGWEFKSGLAVAINCHDGKVNVEDYPKGVVHFSCPVEMAQAMRATYLQRQTEDSVEQQEQSQT